MDSSLALSFRKRYIEKILSGQKTVTRRVSKPRIKVGRVYRLRTGFKYLPEQITVQGISAQRLGDMVQEDAVREGYVSLEEFRRDWTSIYKSWYDDQQVWVVDFELLDGIENFKQPLEAKGMGHRPKGAGTTRTHSELGS